MQATTNNDLHRSEILNTRINSFGSSDAKMLYEIGLKGYVSKAYYRRLAVFKGLILPDNISTFEMEVGNQREREIFEYYSSKNNVKEGVFNPKYVDNGANFLNSFTATGDFTCHTHIDMRIDYKDVSGSCFYEIKTSKKTTAEILELYSAQLMWHFIILSDDTANFNKLFLLHYNEDFTESAFNVVNITEIDKESDFYNKAGEFTKIINDGLLTIDEFFQDPDIDQVLLSGVKEKNTLTTLELGVEFQKQLVQITDFMRLSKEMEKLTVKLKSEVSAFMMSEGLDIWNFGDLKANLIKETSYSRFDEKAFAAMYPSLYQEFLKPTTRKQYLKLDLINKTKETIKKAEPFGFED
jgi:hypothetical protein